MTDSNTNSAVGHPMLSPSARAKGAMLAAAAGDALGWPQEMGGRRGSNSPHPSPGFRDWSRRSGSRFYYHVERIRQGEYSDDTQLILSTARSLRYSNDWLKHLTSYELPAWLAYERGGGRATKAAAESWSKRQAPWLDRDARRYFDAGGNGVAMRVLPHCLVAIRDPNFSNAAQAIVANGLTTHGHPRALVGALAYGYVLWSALRSQQTLSYGSLIATALSELHEWSEFPPLHEKFRDWLHARAATLKTRIEDDWRSAVKEQTELLETAAAAMKKGALSVDQGTLEAMGCFDKHYGAAGTRTAAGALFLASRFAADPMNGLLLAAFAAGADPDTLASMTGGLLGAVAGYEWLGALAAKVQDAQYLTSLTASLLSGETRTLVPTTQSAANRQKLLAQLETQAIGQQILLADGRHAEVLERIPLEPSAVSWRLKCEDGQIIYVKRFGKKSQPSTPAPQEPNLFTTPDTQASRATPRIGTKIFVDDVAPVRDFYQKVLGLETRQSADFVTVGTILAIFSLQSGSASAPQLHDFTRRKTILWVETPDIAQTFIAVKAYGATVVTPLGSPQDPNCFRCLDPAGNLVEVYAPRSVQKQAGSVSTETEEESSHRNRAAKAGAFWTPDEEQRIRTEFALRKPIPEIAQAHGRTPAAIAARLVKMGLMSRPQ